MKFVILFICMVLAVIVSLCFTLSAAKDCGDRGGEFVKNWAGWPVCVGATR